MSVSLFKASLEACEAFIISHGAMGKSTVLRVTGGGRRMSRPNTASASHSVFKLVNNRGRSES